MFRSQFRDILCCVALAAANAAAAVAMSCDVLNTNSIDDDYFTVNSFCTVYYVVLCCLKLGQSQQNDRNANIFPAICKRIVTFDGLRSELCSR